MVNKKEAIKSAKQFVRENLAIALSLDCTGTTAKTRRGLQHLASIKNKDKQVQTIYEMVLSAAIKAERVSPGSGLIVLKMFVGLQDYDVTSLRTKNDVIEHLKSMSLTPKCFGILEEAFKLCTTNSKISLNKSSTDKSYIELSEGYTFSVKPVLKDSSLVFSKPKIACVDGYIENVSEIHHLLSELAESRFTCLLFVRGLSEEVSYTLKTNIDRGTVVAYPFVVPYDLDNVNTLVDLAVVSETDVISTTKGQLISAMTLKNLGSVQTAIIKDTNITIKNSSSKKRVQEHVGRLKKSIEEREDVSEFLSSRIKSLSSTHIQINLAEDINFYSNTQQLDEGIRLISSFISNTYSPVETARVFFKSIEKSIDNVCTVYFE